MGRARVAVVGGTGRMGQRLLRLLAEHDSLILAAVLQRPGGRAPPDPIPVAHSAADAVARADVVIDFSAPPACAQVAPACAQAGVPYVLASTGLSPSDGAALAQAAEKVAVLPAANLSLGVTVMQELVELAAKRLRRFDIEICELHHRHKRDAPSGTALALGAAAQRGAGPHRQVFGRHGVSEPRQDEQLGYAALRGGDVAGEHTVYFFGEAERVEITHRSTSGDIFAAGALQAARWLLGRPPGTYSMRDVVA